MRDGKCKERHCESRSPGGELLCDGHVGHKGAHWAYRSDRTFLHWELPSGYEILKDLESHCSR